MDFSSDFVRREAKASQADHLSVMRSMKELVSRLFNGESTESAVAKADFATGGLNRRRFIQVGGLTVATAAVFAACGTDDSGGATSADAGEKAKPNPADARGDIQILRTASSLEVLAVEVYDKAIKSGLVKTPAVGDAAALFQGHHQEHAEMFQGATKKLGGTPMSDPNPVLAQSLEGPIAALTDETTVVQLALMLEQAAAATYQSSVGQFKDLKLNQAAMSVGGVEARHAAVLAGVLKQPQVPKAFQTRDGAVAAGTGV